MPLLQTQILDSDQNKKTILLNISDIAKRLNLDMLYVVKFLEIEVNGATPIHKEHGAVINGEHQANTLQQLLQTLIREFVLCPLCKLPELSHAVHFSKSSLMQKCAACGYKDFNESQHILKTHIICNPPVDCNGLTHDDKVFLRACANFKSVRENAVLFVSGFIRTHTENCCAPSDIIAMISNTCYDCAGMMYIKDEFDASHIRQWNKYGQIFELDPVDNKVKMLIECENPQLVYGKYVTNWKTTRMLWRIKMLKRSTCRKKTNGTFKIGLIECNRSKEPLKYEIVENETVFDDDGYCYYLNIKEGDVVSLLFIRYKSNKKRKAKVLIRFWVNDKLYPKTFDIEDMCNRKRSRYRLFMKMSQRMVLQLLSNNG
eukprot:532963_1